MKIRQKYDLRSGLKDLADDQRGVVAIMLTVYLPVLVGLFSLAVDMSYVLQTRDMLQIAAESAALASASNRTVIQNNLPCSSGTSSVCGIAQQYAAYNMPTAQYGNVLPAANILVGKWASGCSGSTCFTSTVPVGTSCATCNAVKVTTQMATANGNALPLFFAQLIGLTSVNLTASAVATASPLTYINYYIVVDISQSMGIGSTATDMSNLYSRVVAYNNGNEGEVGCVFGCHVKAQGNNGTNLQTYTNEYLAHSVSPAITLRIDAAVTAIQSIISAAQAAAGTNQNIKIGLYTMSENPVSGTLLNTISAPSSNYTSLTSLAATIDLGNNETVGLGDSDFADQLSQFNTILPANGSGASASSPANYVFLITDGLIDTPGSGCTSGHCTGAFSPSYCTNLKAKATVGVIYTTYLPIYNQNNSANGYETNYKNLVLPYVNQIAPNLEACATSSSYYFEASDGPAISTAMQSLFAASQPGAGLTN
jgi:putative Flp pilus-assembly TadE/G-like protein